MTTQAELTSPISEQKGTQSIYKVLVMAILMMVIGGSLTGVMTYMNVGLSETFMSSWLSSFALVVVVMMPIGMLMMTQMTRVVARLFYLAKVGRCAT